MEITPKKGWKQLTNKELLKFYDKIFDRAVSLGYIESDNKPKLYVDNAVNRLGVCNWKSEKVFGSKKYKCQISLNPQVVNETEQAKKTLVHELAHACSPEEHHSYLWQAKGNKIGQPFGITVSRTESNESLPDSLKRDTRCKYIVKCPVCGKEFGRMKMVNLISNPERYWCCDKEHRLIRIK